MGGLVVAALSLFILTALLIVTSAQQGPTLSTSTLNLNSNFLEMEFNDLGSSISLNDIDCTKLRLGATLNDAMNTYALSQPAAGSISTSTISCPIGPDLQIMIKTDPAFGIAMTPPTTFIYIEAGTGIMNDNGMELAPDTVGIAVPNLIADTNPPSLLSYELNLSTGEIKLSFSEALNVSSFNPTVIVLRIPSDIDGGPFAFSLMGGSVAFENSICVTLTLTVTDLNAIKLNDVLAVSQSSSLITFDSTLVADASGNSVIPTFSLQPSVFTPDTAPPSLIAFGLDMNTGILELTFSEAVIVSTLDLAFTTLQSAPNLQAVSLTPSGGTSLSPDGPVVSVLLLSHTFDAIKLISTLATGPDNTYLSLMQQTVQDTNANPVVEIFHTQALAVTTFTEDTTPPQLVSFTADLNSGQLVLSFDEPMNVSSIRPSWFILQSGNSAPFSSYQLTSGSTSSADGLVIPLDITEFDLNAIKALTNLFVSLTTSYLSFFSGAIEDLNANPISVVGQSQAMRTIQFTPDRTRPELTSFDLDLTARVEQISLTFSETVITANIDVTQITLLMEPGEAVFLHTLTAMSTPVNPIIGPTVQIDLSPGDVSAIDMSAQLAVTSSTTYISITENLIQDARGLQNVAISSSDALQVSNYTARPILLSFGIDLDAGSLQLTFSRIVNGSSLIRNNITLQSASALQPESSLTLEPFAVAIPTSTILELQFTGVELNDIKRMLTLATSINNTWISIAFPGVYDTFDSPLVPVDASDAVQATVYTSDETSPNLISFGIDLDAGALSLVFDETVSANSLDVTQITLQSSATTSTSTSMYTLTGGTILSSNNTVLAIELMTVDTNSIKGLTDLAIGPANTFISLTSQAVQDTNGNPVTPVPPTDALQVAGFTPDTTSPVLLSYMLNLTAGDLHFLFDETLNSSSFDPTSLQLSSDQSGIIDSYNFTGGTATLQDFTSVMLGISEEDLDEIKLNDNLAISLNTAFLSSTATLVTDTSGNLVLPTSFLQASVFFPDTTPPILQNFGLDLDAGVLHLLFSEPVRVSTLSFNDITICNAPNLASASYTLTGGSTESTNGRQIDLNLLQNDLNGIKLLSTLATGPGDTYLSITSGAVQDTNFNPVVSIPITMALQVAEYIQDTTPPQLVSFSADLNTGLLALSFNEPVSVSSINPSRFILQSGNSGMITSYQLTTGSTSSTDGLIIALSIAPSDLNLIKTLIDLFVNLETSYLRFLPGAIEDMNMNPISALDSSQAIPASLFTADTTRPELSSFDLDLTAEQVILSFSETVNVSTLDVTQITLLIGPGEAIMMYSLSELSSTFSPNSPVVEVNLSSSDLNFIKTFPQLAVSRSTTYISVTENLIRDTNANPNLAISSTEALQANSYTVDTVRPILQSFGIDMDTGNLLLSFSETVNGSSLVRSSFTLQSLSTATETSLTLESFAISLPTNVSLVLQLTIDELNEVKRIPTLATSINNCWISVQFPGVYDAFANPLLPIDADSALQAAVFIPDQTQPTLASFDVDLNIGTLSLTFDETVLASSLLPNQITLLNFGFGMSTSLYTLTGGTVLSPDDPVLVIEFLPNDINTVKGMADLATTANNTFISLTTQVVADTNGNEIIPIPPTNALQVASITPDTTSPVLVSFTLDLTAAELQFTFNEIVTAGSFNPTRLRLASDEIGNSSYILTGGTVTALDSIFITLTLSEEDLNAIKLNDNLATSRSNAFLNCESSLVADTSGNFVVPIPSTSSVQASTFISDTVSPLLLSFGLDLNTGVLQLVFSEPVRASTLNHPGITLQNGAGLVSESYTLTGGSIDSTDGLQIVVTILQNDLNNIKLLPTLATSEADTYISVTLGAIQDTNSNPLLAITPSTALQVAVYTEDIAPPVLVSFTADLDAGLLTLNFDEPVNASSIKPDRFILQSGNSEMTTSYQLTGGSTTSPNGIVITLDMAESDLNEIKRLTNLFVSLETSYLRFLSESVEDMNGNALSALNSSQAFQATAFLEDETNPDLISFDLDINARQIIMTFSETINVATFDPTQITLENFGFGMSTLNYALTSGSVLSPDDPVLVFQLLLVDSNIIKALGDLATSIHNTFISLTSQAVQDTNGNPVTPVPPSDALQVASFTPDTTSPVLLSYMLNLTAGDLHFLFDETVNSSSFDPTSLQLSSDQSGIIDSYNFTGGTATLQDFTSIILTISEEDLNAIKLNDNLATSLFNTFLSFDASLVTDTSGNPISSIPNSSGLQPVSFTEDSVSPLLTRFQLDLNTGNLQLVFSEPVTASTFNHAGITLQSTGVADASSTSYTLMGGSTGSTDGLQITVTVSLSDLNNIKLLLALATSETNTYISVTSETIRDTNSNPLVAIAPDAALPVSVFTPDTTPPQLVSFSTDFNVGLLVLTFDEPVNVSAIDPTQIILETTATNASSTYQLTSGFTNSSNGVYIQFYISEFDLNQIRTLSDLFVSLETSFLHLEFDTITDLSGNSIALGETIQTSLYISDATHPVVSSFDLDMNTGILCLHLSEVVDLSGLNISAISLQRSFLVVSSSDSHSLSGGSVLPMGVTVCVQLSAQDLNQLKTLSIGTDTSSIWLSISEESGIVDSAGRSVIPLVNGVNTLPVSEYTPDTTPPDLVQFLLDLNLGTLGLTFSETVDVSTLNVTSIALQNAASSPETTFFLSTSLPITVVNEPVLNVALSRDDLNGIKSLSSLATSFFNTYLSIQTRGVVDVFANDVVGISTETALQASVVIPDTTRPILESFTLDLTSEVLVLTFSETVNASSLYVPALYLIRNSLADNTSSYRLTTDSQIQDGDPTGQDSVIIVVELGTTDLNSIKINEVLATARSNTFLSIDETLILDTSTNAIEPIPISFPLQVATFIADTIAPTLISFGLDLNAGLLWLTFSESVRASSLHPPSITLQNASSVSAISFTLTGGSTSSANGPVILLQITLEDLDNIKRLSDLATDTGNTYLSILEAAIHDTNFNPLVSVDPETALQSIDFITDTTRPILVSYNINLNPIETLTLSFDETVRVGSLDPTQITIHNSRSGAMAYNLSGGALISPDDPVQVIELLSVDVNSIKVLTDLATSADNTFISLTPQLIEDTSGNQVEPVLPGAALQVVNYSADITSPVLLSYDFDLTSGTLQFVFDEPINISSFQPTVLQLLGSPSAINSTHGLTGGTVVMDNSISLTLFLTVEDLNAIKVNEALATSVNDTFLSFTTSLVEDISENPIVSTTVQVSNFTPDTVPPLLLAFGIDLDMGSLDLEFSEPVRASALNPSGITLQSDNDSALVSYTLTDGSTDSQNGQQISLNISVHDLNNIKLLPALARDAASTYLSITSGVVLDINFNPVIPISSDSAISVNLYERDTTPPRLTSFSTDFNAGQLVLTFDEPVNISTVDATRFRLQSEITTNSTSYELTTGFTNSSDGAFFPFYLSDFDINQIKGLDDLFMSFQTSYLRFGFDAVRDLAGNAIVPAEAVQTSVYISDSNRPAISAFDLDMDTGTLTLYFTETINIIGLNFSAIILQRRSFVTNPTDYHRLTGGTVSGINAMTVIQLFTEDVNQLKTLNIGIDSTSVWLAVEEDSGIMDSSGNRLVPLINGVNALPVTQYTADTTPPELVEFTLDLNLGALWLVFTETVNASSFDPTSVTLQNTASNADTTFTLSTDSLNSVFDEPIQRVSFASDDLNEIKRLYLLAIDVNSTFITIQREAVLDVFGNEVVEITTASALQASAVFPDTTSPVLESFSLDLTLGELQLFFDETVNINSFDPTRLQLLPDPLEITNVYTFAGGSVSLENSTRITVILTMDDLNAVKLNEELATSQANTFLQFDNALVMDMSGNSIEPTSGLQAANFIEDVVPPMLVRFELDMDVGLVSLSFSEPVRNVWLNQSRLILQNESTSPTSIIALISNSLDGPNGLTISLSIPPDDLNSIKEIPNLATSINDTFLQIAAGTVEDINFNAVMESILQVGTFTPDTTPPLMVSFTANLNLGLLTLTFDEPVNVLSIVFTQTILQSASSTNSTSYQLTSGFTNSSNGRSIEVYMTEFDINEIKLLQDLFVSRETTYLRILPDAIADVAGNFNLNIPPIQAMLFIADTTSPVLLSFDFAIDPGELTLYFNEVIDHSSLDVSGIILQREFNVTTSSDFYRLTNGSVIPIGGTVTMVQLTELDINHLKALRIGVTNTSVWCVVDSDTILDLSGIPLEARVNGESAISVSLYTPDTTRPQLEGFRLDLTREEFILSFTEAIDVDSFDPTRLHLAAGQLDNSSTYALTGGEVAPQDTVVDVALKLTEADLNTIKVDDSLATAIGNTFLHFDNTLVLDTSGNDIEPTLETSALQANDFIPDQLPPSLLVFALDMDEGLLLLTFSEPVRVGTLSYMSFSIQNAPDSPSVSYSLTGGLSGSDDGVEIIINLLEIDLNGLKSLTDLGTDRNNTYLSALSEAIQDTNSNQLSSILPVSALQVNLYTADTTPPVLLQFDLDMDTGLFTLVFDETVNTDSINPQGFQLQSNESIEFAEASYQLTGAISIMAENFTTVEIYLLDSDLNEIKLFFSLLATNRLNTFISFSTVIEDTSGLSNVPIPPSNAIQVRMFTADSTGPELLLFDVDFTTETISLTFSEAVAISTIYITQITILMEPSEMMVSYNLTSLSTTASPSSQVVLINLSSEDSNMIKMLPQLAVSRSTTYISITESLIFDTNGNPNTAIRPSEALQVSNYMEDTVDPILDSFQLDVDAGLLLLTFSETVNGSSLDRSSFTLQNASTLTTSSLILEANAVTLPLDVSLVLQLTNNELNQLKRISTLATSMNDTWISVEFSGVYDTSGNPLVEIETNDALQTAGYVFDETQPLLLSFTIDLNSGMLLLSFDETVRARSLTLTEITLQNSESITFATAYSFTGGTLLSSDDPVLVAQLLVEDVNSIKGLTDLATGANNTFLSLTERAVEDVDGNPITFISPNFALPVSDFIADMTSPSMLSFSLNLTAGEMQFVFDETVDASSFNPTQLLLISDTSPVATDYTLTGGLVSAESGTVIALSLAVADLNAIKLDEGLATSISNTFLAFAAQLVADTNSNQIASVSSSFALQVGTFTEDVVGPRLICFQLDLDTGLLQLTFSEPVRVSSLNPTAFTLQDTATMPTVNYTLTNGQSISPNDLDIILILSDDDLNSIKLIPDLATDQNSTYLSATSEAIQDMNANELSTIPPISALQVNFYAADTTPPQLVSFATDLEVRLLSLTFDEPVNTLSLQIDRLVLQSQNSNDATFYQLTDGFTNSSNGLYIEVYITEVDLNQTEQLNGLFVNMQTAYLRMLSAAIEDTAGNTILTVAPTEAIQTSSYVGNIGRPVLLSFDLDMDEGVLTLSFDEPVVLVNFSIDALTLQQQFSVIDFQEFFQLTGGFTDLISNATIAIRLITDDINGLKALRIGVSNTSAWLAIDSTAIVDLFGVPLQARVNGQSTIPVSIYIPDTTQPELMEFSLDLNVGIMSLTFSETVVASTFDSTSVTLQNAASDPSTFFILSAGFQSSANDQPIQEVTLNRDDLNAIKRLYLLATSSNNSYTTIEAGGVLDIFDNPVLEINTEMALQVSEFISDVTSPVLESYSLDLNAGTLQFVFSETVNVGTFNPTSIQLARDPFETNSTYTLTGGQTSTENSTQVSLIFVLDDVNTIKLDDTIATSLSNTFLSVNAMLVRDMNNNPLLPVSRLQASEFIKDQLSPTLLNFQLDLNRGLLILGFSEPVRVATLNVTGLTLQNTVPLQSHFMSYQLTSSFSDGINDPVITITMTSDDLDSIKLIPELATNRDSTYLSVSSGVIQDTNSNPNTPISADSPLQVASLGYIPDTTPPQLESYTANMFVGLLSLTFDEPINASSVKPNRFTLRARNLENSTFYQLTGGFTNSSNGRVMDLYMTEFDLQQINSESSLFVSMATTYLHFSFDALQDMAENAIVGLAPSAAVPVARFIGDSSRPVLESFDLDMNLGILVLYFNENVTHTSLDVGGIILQKEFSVVEESDYYRLTEGTVNPLNSLTIAVMFSTVDINELKSRRIGVMRTSAYLAVDRGAILDEFGEQLLERVNGESTISATVYVPDATPPQVMLFRLDLNMGILWLFFSETVDANTFDPTSVTLQNAASSPSTSFTLSADSRNSFSDQPLQRLTLSIDDLNEIKRLFPLGATIDTAYLTIISGGVMDVFENSVIEINSLSALQADEVILDTTPPLLQSYTLDLTNLECQFVFDETVNSSSFDPTRLQIIGIASNSYTLTGGEILETGNTLRITLLIDTSDANAIKTNDNIATSLSNTFLQYDEMLVTDVYDNPVEPRLGSSAIQASDFTPDLISPILLSFELDMDAGLLQFLFSEPVRVITLDPTVITLQSTPLPSSVNYQLTGGLTESPNGPRVALSVPLDDLNNLKQMTDLATNENTSFISITSEMIQDMASNAVASIAADSALPVTVFTPDTTPPELTSFELDLRSGGLLILQFSEAIWLSEEVLSEVFLQSNEVNASVIVNLTDSLAITLSLLKDRAEIALSPELFEILLADPSIGASLDTLFITVTEEAVNDFNNNSLLPIPSSDALRVSVIYVDECSTGRHNCDPLATCFDNTESFSCVCNLGYAGDGVTCSDVDECSLGQHNCHVLATCDNTFGSFTCTCNPDTRGDGITCEAPTLCPPEENIPLFPESSVTYDWPLAETGNTETQPCPEICQALVSYPQGAVVRRACVQTGGTLGVWRDADFALCQVDVTALRLCEANQLGSEMEIATVVAEITSNTSVVDVSTVAVASSIIEELTTAAIEDVQVRDQYLETIDNLIEAEPEVILESQMQSNASTRILRSLDTLTDSILIPENTTERTVVLARDNFAILVQDIDPDNFSGEAFSVDLGSVDQVVRVSNVSGEQLVRNVDVVPNSTASVELPDSLFFSQQDAELALGNASTRPGGTSERLSYSVFLTDTLFATPNTTCSQSAIGSIIVSVRANTNLNLSEGILLNFQRLSEICDGIMTAESVATCATFDRSGAGRWTSDNCRVISDEGGRTSCDCRQLGHFGLLFDLNPGTAIAPLALSVISYIGAVVSTLCLVIIIATYCTTKKLRSTVHGRLLVQLCIALIGLYVSFILGGLVTTVPALCGVVSALLHYFTLAFFGWTAIEAFHLYQKLVTVLGTESNHFVLKAAVVAWLTPLVVVVVSVAAGHDYYVNPFYCRPTEYPFWFGLILPFGIIYLLNWIIFVVIMVSITKQTQRAKNIQSPGKVSQVKKLALIAIGLSLIFGLGWGLGLAATSSDIEELTFTFQLIFSIFVGSQGLLIFIFHGVRSKDARDAWKSWLYRLLCIERKRHYQVVHSKATSSNISRSVTGKTTISQMTMLTKTGAQWRGKPTAYKPTFKRISEKVPLDSTCTNNAFGLEDTVASISTENPASFQLVSDDSISIVVENPSAIADDPESPVFTGVKKETSAL